MAYATNKERMDLINSSDFGLEFVVRIKTELREDELCADDINHALELQKSWIDKEAKYVEIFRVLQHDGSLNTTIGPYFK